MQYVFIIYNFNIKKFIFKQCLLTHCYLDFARIDDESDSVDCDGRFCDVGGDDALANVLGRIVEHLVLVGQREGAVQRENDPFLKINKKNIFSINFSSP